jgi:hypothetical protein
LEKFDEGSFAAVFVFGGVDFFFGVDQKPTCLRRQASES